MDYMDGFNGQREENRENPVMTEDSETGASSNRDELNRKLRQTFDGKIVRKDLTKHIKEGANVLSMYWDICLASIAILTMRRLLSVAWIL